MQNTEARKAFEARCLHFGGAILKTTWPLFKDPRLKPLADQLMRSGTSVGANVQEGQAAQSRADFIHKLQIALKEARETCYWLQLLIEASITPLADLSLLLNECNQIAAILAKSILTAKENGLRQTRLD